MNDNLQIIGLVFDAAGIAILGIPAVFTSVRDIAEQSGTYWDANPHAAKAKATQCVDTTTGSVFLILGFILQIASLSGFVVGRRFLVFLAVILGIALFLYWCDLRNRFSKYLTDKSVKLVLQGEEEADESSGDFQSKV